MIFVSAFPFGRVDAAPLDLLRSSGFPFQLNPEGRILRAEESASLAARAQVIIAGSEELRPLIELSTTLRMIARVGIGLDSVPLELCRQRGIAVSYTPDAVTSAVGELALGLLIATMRSVGEADHGMRAGRWDRIIGRRIGDCRIGILGFGRAGAYLARLLVPFRPRQILIHDIRDRRVALKDIAGDLPAEQTDLDTLLANSDAISIHLPLTSATRNMIGAAQLQRMPAGSWLVQTSRGGILDEDALLAAVRGAHLRGAALDVFGSEPYTGPMLGEDRILLTQHMGSCAADARAAMERGATEDALRFLRGEALASAAPLEGEF
ncbi:MAG: dehydrogenase [Leptospirales bacterium]|nr:dehydrogenase [Leptospirales bacterium]